MERRKRICIFCSSRYITKEISDKAYKIAYSLGENYDLVWGGGLNGLMGDVYFGFNDRCANCYAICMEQFMDREPVPKDNWIIKEVYDNLQDRIKRMIELADGFLILEGGIGTLQEFASVYVEVQSKFIDKPIIVDNSTGFYAFLYSSLYYNKKVYNLGSLPDKYVKWIHEKNINKTVETIKEIVGV